MFSWMEVGSNFGPADELEDVSEVSRGNFVLSGRVGIKMVEMTFAGCAAGFRVCYVFEA